MSDIYLEQDALQNPLLGSSLIWTTCAEHTTANNPRGLMPLPLVLTILPILFHRASVEAIKGMQLASGLGKAVTDHRFFTIGLQARVEDMTSTSMRSILLGCACSLLDMNNGSDWPDIGIATVGEKLPPALQATDEQVRDMHKAAKRLGKWFAINSPAELFRLLRVVF